MKKADATKPALKAERDKAKFYESELEQLKMARDVLQKRMVTQEEQLKLASMQAQLQEDRIDALLTALSHMTKVARHAQWKAGMHQDRLEIAG